MTVTPANNTRPTNPAAGDLEAAYRATTYHADVPAGRLGIRIGQRHPQLDLLLVQHDCRTWAYLTAWNPASQRLADEDNHRRQRQLEEDVAGAGLVVYRGQGVGEDGTWPPEPSLLILGLDQATATTLAEAHGQLALVCGTAGEPARLVWTGLAR